MVFGAKGGGRRFWARGEEWRDSPTVEVGEVVCTEATRKCEKDDKDYAIPRRKRIIHVFGTATHMIARFAIFELVLFRPVYISKGVEMA